MLLPSLSILIPCYNDEQTIETVIREAHAVGRSIARVFEIVLINDGSTDRTGQSIARLARKFPDGVVRIITHRTNQGYGRTIKQLYYSGRYDWLFSIPGDYQIGAKELLRILSLRPGGRADRMPDMIVGRRLKRHDPGSRILSSWIYNTLIRALFGVPIHDVNSVRLMRRAILKDIRLTSDSAFVDAELVIRATRAGFDVGQVPIRHRSRSDGGSGGGNQWGTIRATIIDMIRFLL
jgi:glycosyltransferase involved in cell wall biosynthesis